MFNLSQTDCSFGQSSLSSPCIANRTGGTLLQGGSAMAPDGINSTLIVVQSSAPAYFFCTAKNATCSADDVFALNPGSTVLQFLQNAQKGARPVMNNTTASPSILTASQTSQRVQQASETTSSSTKSLKRRLSKATPAVWKGASRDVGPGGIQECDNSDTFKLLDRKRCDTFNFSKGMLTAICASCTGERIKSSFDMNSCIGTQGGDMVYAQK